jgi:hypothetical protein
MGQSITKKNLQFLKRPSILKTECKPLDKKHGVKHEDIRNMDSNTL